MRLTPRKLTACLLLAASLFLLGAGYAPSGAHAQGETPSGPDGSTSPEATTIPADSQDTVLFPNAHTDWQSWHMSYLRQQGLVIQDPEYTDVTAGQLNQFLNDTAAQIALAFGVEAPEYQVYFSGPDTGYESLKAGLAAFQAQCQGLDAWATAPNYHLEQLKQVDEEERDICLNDIFNFAAVLHKTEFYIAQFDPEWYAIKGADYLNERYDATRIGKSLDEIDGLVDYDFAQLAETTDQLVNIDRRRTLSAIFSKVTEGAESDLDKHLALLQFLDQAGNHSTLQALREDGRMVEDPLVLLELGEMMCGHVARVGCDLFSAGGYPSRLVQAGGHVLAEVYYGQGWHYFDADSNVAAAVVVDGNIPSMVELSQTPGLVDTAGNWWLIGSADTALTGMSTQYKSASYFSRAEYTTQPLYMVKTATAQMELNDCFGWDSIAYVSDPDRQLYDDLPELTTPEAPALTDITYDEAAHAYTLTWETSRVEKGELAGYRVYVSEESCGWDWNTFYGDESLRDYRAGAGYQPGSLAQAAQGLPADVDLIELGPEATCVTIPIREGQSLYVSLVAFDAHGEEVGNQLYPPSTEFLLTA